MLFNTAPSESECVSGRQVASATSSPTPRRKPRDSKSPIKTRSNGKFSHFCNNRIHQSKALTSMKFVDDNLFYKKYQICCITKLSWMLSRIPVWMDEMGFWWKQLKFREPHLWTRIKINWYNTDKLKVYWTFDNPR